VTFCTLVSIELCAQFLTFLNSFSLAVVKYDCDNHIIKADISKDYSLRLTIDMEANEASIF